MEVTRLHDPMGALLLIIYLILTYLANTQFLIILEMDAEPARQPVGRRPEQVRPEAHGENGLGTGQGNFESCNQPTFLVLDLMTPLPPAPRCRKCENSGK